MVSDIPKRTRSKMDGNFKEGLGYSEKSNDYCEIGQPKR